MTSDRSARPVNSAFSRRTLDAAPLASAFEREGYLLFPRLLTRRATAQAQRAASRLLRRRHASVPSGWLLGLHQRNQPEPQRWVERIAADPAVARLVRALLGGSRPVLVSSQLFVKRAAGRADDEAAPSSGEVPWHQDGAAGGYSLAIWLPLDAIDPTGHNGGLAVLPRLHASGRLPSEPCEANAASFDRIQPEALAGHEATAVRYALAAGGAGLHGPLTPHSSPPNASGADRRVLVLRYCAAGAPAVRGERLWAPGGAVAAAGGEPRTQIPCWSSGELIDRQGLLVGGEGGAAAPSPDGGGSPNENGTKRKRGAG